MKSLTYNHQDFPRMNPSKVYWRLCMSCDGEGITIADDGYAYRCVSCRGVGKLDLPLPKPMRRVG